ncbi:hypothetical protein [Vibrio nigripulchritudo]|nr:hypothetical protein [Vibrio nigripulchritudo]CCN69404.1 hypothetical protein VIBNISFn118_1320003 [Vibrio nigripulchritudo SFn118]
MKTKLFLLVVGVLATVANLEDERYWAAAMIFATIAYYVMKHFRSREAG